MTIALFYLDDRHAKLGIVKRVSHTRYGRASERSDNRNEISVRNPPSLARALLKSRDCKIDGGFGSGGALSDVIPGEDQHYDRHGDYQGDLHPCALQKPGTIILIVRH
jgi:hypothetical protein